MDPKATLEAAHEEFNDGDYARALSLLADYFQWRLKGGFQPEGFGGLSADEAALNWMNTISLNLQQGV